MRTIKKYANRRLYDTAEASYVNLQQVGDLIRQGETIEVVDAKTGEDLTRMILLQLLVEQQGADLFPIGLLHRMLRFSTDSPLHAAAVKQMGLGLSLLDQQLAQAETQWPWMRGAAKAQPRSEETVQAPRQPTSPAASAPSDGLDALRERLAALEERLKS